MRSTAVQLLKLKPQPASAFGSLRLPPSASRTKPASAGSAASRAKPSAANVATELEGKLIARQELGSNVRFSNHISNKELYWKVSKSQRDVLKKVLREA